MTRINPEKTAFGIALAGLLALAPPAQAQAQEQEAASVLDWLTVSGSVSLTSDYRFRGVSLSDEDFAIQGAINLTADSGFYLGVWGSSIENFNGAETEIDIFGGYRFTLSGTQIDIGATGFVFPGGKDTHYVEPYIRATRGLGNLSATLGVAYAPDQDNIGGRDNIYLSADTSYLLTSAAGLPLSLAGHVGYEDGAFGNDKVDWSLGLSTSWRNLSFGISYTDTATSGDNTDATVLFSVGASF